jgi:Secretion system C-terminal sorting domain
LKNLVILLLIVTSLIFLKYVIGSAVSEKDDDDDETLVNVQTPDGGLLTCGVERWSIKTLTDSDTSSINFGSVIPSTIQYQRSKPAPLTLPNTRLQDEDTLYSLDCIMYKYKLEADNDIHIVICAVNDASQTMVAEIVNADCPGIINTSRYSALKNLRTWFDSTYHPTTSFTNTNIHIKLTGIGFYDFLHGQTGIPPNGREIHPILSFSLVTGINSGTNEIPSAFKLNQNFPNPFNPSTNIKFELPKNSIVKLTVFDILGKELTTLVNERLNAGAYSVDWDGTKYPSGVYFCRIETEGFTDTKRMLMIK